MSRVENTALRYELSECEDMPEKVYETRFVQMSRRQKEVSNAILEGLLVELGNGKLTCSNVLVKGLKLSQVTGGFLLGDDGSVMRLPLSDNPKLRELVDCLNEISGKVVIYHHFVEEGRMIEELCRRQNISYRSLRGEVKDKDRQAFEFINNPDVKVLVAHPASGGEGLNLQMANTVVFYSNDYSGGITRAQAEGRIFRKGQNQRCVFIDILAKGSVDETIYSAVCSSKNMAQAVLDWIAYGSKSNGRKKCDKSHRA